VGKDLAGDVEFAIGAGGSTDANDGAWLVRADGIGQGRVEIGLTEAEAQQISRRAVALQAMLVNACQHNPGFHECWHEVGIG